MATLGVFPSILERGTAPEALSPAQARILQRVETDWFEGRMRRCLGVVPMVPYMAAAHTIWSGCAMVLPNGDTVFLVEDDSGTVTLVTAISPAYTNNDAFGAANTTAWYENFNEDGPDN